VSVVSSLTDLSVLEPLAIPVLRPVRIDVEWAVVGPAGDLADGVDYVTSAVEPLAAGFIVKPPFVPSVVDLDPNPLDGWLIRARVTVSVGTLAGTRRELLLPISLAPLPVPELAALFRHDHFKPYEDDNAPGFLLLVVPDWSPVRAIGETFNDLMDDLDRAMRPLRTLAGIAAFLSGIEALRLAAAGQPMTRVHPGDVPDLDDVIMRVETTLGMDWLNRDLRAGDRTTAIIVFGPPGTTFAFYDDEKYDLSHGEWAFQLTTGLEMAVVVPDLRPAKPPTLPPMKFEVLQHGGGASFNDNLTSVRFGADPGRG
jgi:hypothetical protein